MSRFKVGDRVKITNDFNGCWGINVGDIGVIKKSAGGDDWWVYCDKWTGDHTWCFAESKLEPAPQFKVGDEVRVKAGSPTYSASMHVATREYPTPRWTGKRLVVGNGHVFEACFTEDRDSVVSHDYLEPWNPAEEWNGSAWVKREVAKPAIVAIRRDQGKHWAYTEVCSSTNEAFRKADEFAATSPGTEYVVYQEKGSRRVEKKSKTDELADRFKGVHSTYDGTLKMEYTTESVKVVGDEVIVAYKVKS